MDLDQEDTFFMEHNSHFGKEVVELIDIVFLGLFGEIFSKSVDGTSFADLIDVYFFLERRFKSFVDFFADDLTTQGKVGIMG